jgi:hypothetical protein
MSEEGTKPPTDKSAEDGSRSADPERLLPGENPETDHLEDASHWMAVYQELLDFKVDLMTVAGEAQRTSRQPAVIKELGATDVPILERERQRFEHRLAIWTDRYQELGGREECDPAAPPADSTP